MIRRDCLHIVACIALPLCATVPSLCQNSSPGAAPSDRPESMGPKSGIYTLDVKSQLVVLDVVVTDEHGAVVSNLSKNDFQVYEDKRLQRIHSVEAPDSHVSQPSLSINSTAELDRLEPTSPVNIIVLDELTTLPEDEAFARYSLKKYFSAQGDRLAQPTMLIAADLRQFMVLHDYTTSKSDLLAALKHHFTAYPWHLQADGWAAEQFNAAFASLIEIAEATAGHPGHKNMIWIGRGFPSLDIQSLAPPTAAKLMESIKICTNMLRDARVTIYTIDPAGLSGAEAAQDADGTYEEDPFGGQIDFNGIARETGGKAFFGRNDVDNLIQTSAREGSEFYTLSYIPSVDSSDSKEFRNIHVVLNNPHLQATTRTGYYVTPATTAPPRTVDGKPAQRLMFDLSVAEQSLMVYDGVPIAITRDPKAPDNFLIHIKSSDIAWHSIDENSRSADITLLVESFDEKGKVLHRAAKSLVLHSSTPHTESESSAHLAILTSVPTEHPATRIRFVLRVNEDGRLGADNYLLVGTHSLAGPATGPDPLHERH